MRLRLVYGFYGHAQLLYIGLRNNLIVNIYANIHNCNSETSGLMRLLLSVAQWAAGRVFARTLVCSYLRVRSPPRRLSLSLSLDLHPPPPPSNSLSCSLTLSVLSLKQIVNKMTKKQTAPESPKTLGTSLPHPCESGKKKHLKLSAICFSHTY